MTKKTEIIPSPMEEIWNAAAKAGFDHMGEFPRKNVKGFEVTRCKDICADFPEAAKVMVALEESLLGLGFVKKVWNKNDLSHQYVDDSVVVALDLSRKGIYLYAGFW